MSINQLKKINQKTETDTIREYYALSWEEKEKYILAQPIERKLAIIERIKELIGEDLMKGELLDRISDEYDIELRQAANLYTLTTTLFSIAEIKMEVVFRDIRKTQKLAEAKQDPKAKAIADKNKLSAIKQLQEFDNQGYTETEMPIIMLGFYPELVMHEDVSLEELEAFVEAERSLSRKKLLAEETPSELVEESGDDFSEKI